MPIGHIIMSFFTQNYSLDYQMLFAGLLGGVGFLIIMLFSKTQNEVQSSLLGLLAGILIWTGWVEFSFVYFAERLQIKPLMDGSEVVTRPEYLLMISSAGLVLSVMAVLIVNNTTRCNMFMWIQRVCRLNIPKAASKKNYTALTALETIMLIWFFYILLLVIYDDHLFGDRSWATYAVFFLSLLWSFFLFRNLLRKKHFGKAIRYAIPTVVIFWNAVEILGRWNFFSEFWVEPNKYSVESIIIILCFAVLFAKALVDKHRLKGHRTLHKPI
jgi:hypothetical protein